MSFTETIIGFAHHHPSLVGLVIFLCAMSEAIVVVGALVPGSAIIIVLAGVVGAGRGHILPLVAAATAGAILSDGISYWIGRRYGMRLKEFWPFRKRPDLFDSGAGFFERHGGKSVLIGRFLPGLRAVIPLAAGALGMRAAIFFSASIASALVWASVHILPAAGAGVVLTVVGRISGRLVGAFLAFLVLIGLAAFAARLVASVAVPRLYAAYARAIARLGTARSPFLRRAGAWLDPARANLRAHILWGLVLLACAIGIAGIIRELVNGEALVRADGAISQLAQTFRTPPADRIMVTIASFGDGLVIAAAVAVLIATLFASGARRSAALVATVFLATAAFVPLIRFAFQEQRPADLYPGFELFAFPSSQATLAALFCGVVAVLAAPSLNATGRIVTWAIGLLFAAMVGVARIYLDAQWPSDVFAGLLIGLAVTAIFALIFKDFEGEVEKSIQIPIIAFAGFLAVGGAKAAITLDEAVLRYAPKISVQEIAAADWLADRWRSLPLRRGDLLGEIEEPIIAQIAANPDQIAAALAPLGWQRAEPFAATDLLFFLIPAGPLDAFPPLPLMNSGRLPALTLTHGEVDGQRRMVLRFWRSDFTLRSGDVARAILLSSLTEEHVAHPYQALTVLSDPAPGATALAAVRAALVGLGASGLQVADRRGNLGPVQLIGP
jgi:membrane protein DedA with SNARE-associated domain/membrane-associated phospholipid phosphatase